MRVILSTLILFALVCSVHAGEPAGGIQFFEGEFDQMKALAQQAQKPYFLSFQDNGIPSQNQVRYAFRDPKLRDYVAAEYFAMRILKQETNHPLYYLIEKYQVVFFPTIIIFSAEGFVLNKLIGYTPPINLKDNLSRFRLAPKTSLSDSHPQEAILSLETVQSGDAFLAQPAVVPPVVGGLNIVSRPDISMDSPAREQAASQDSEEYIPVAFPITSVSVRQTSPETTEEEVSLATTLRVPITEVSLNGPHAVDAIPVPVFPAMPSVSDRPESSEVVELEELALPLPVAVEEASEVSRPEEVQEGMAIQTGVFGEYNNAMREASRLEGRYQESVLIVKDQFNGKPVFRILIGPFSAEEAKVFLRNYQAKEGKKALVKDLDQLQK